MIHTPDIVRVGQDYWVEGYVKGSDVHGQETPDRWYASKRTPTGVIVHEVEFSNAGIRPARQTFPCTVTVQAPPGWTLVADCDRPLPTRWFAMHAAMRRYAMYPTSKPNLRAEAILEAQMTYTQMRWRRSKLAYGPCSMPLPKLTSAQLAQESAKVAGWHQRLKQLLSTGGTGPVEDGEDGLLLSPVDNWRAWGIKDRGAPAGSGIRFFTGHEQAPLSPAYSWIKACCNHERWWHAYDRTTGRIINVNDYPNGQPMYQAGTWDPNNGLLPEYRGIVPGPDPLPLPYDASHSIRGFRDLIFLSDATDSPGVKRMLHSVAAQLRLQYSDRGPAPTANYTAPALRTWLGWAKNAPHNGHYGQDTGRMIGWPAFGIAQSIKRGASENIPWAQMMSEFTETVVMPSGIISRCAEQNTSSVWYSPNDDTFHSFEVPIYWFGAVGCATQSGRKIPHPTRFAECLYREAPRLPYYSTSGPPQYGFVAARGGAPYPTVTGGKDNIGDTSNALAGCALAAHLDPANRKMWVDTARSMETFADLNNSAGIVAQQQLL